MWMRRYIAGMCLSVLLSIGASSAANILTAPQFTAQLSLNLSKQVSFSDGIKSMVKHFCSTILAMPPVLDYGPSTSAYLFDPKQSMFLYVLCDDLKVTGSALADDTKYDFIKRRTWEQYGITTQDKYETEWLCAPGWGLQFCNIPQQFFGVYNDIMSTYIDMFQAQIYGANLQWNSAKDRAQAFVKKYLVWLDICPDGNCVYPTTEKRLEKYVKNGQNLRSSVSVIDTKKLAANTAFGDLKKVCSSVGTGYAVLPCAFADVQSTPYKAFLNLIMQEHFFFRLFLTYYDYVIETDRTILPNNYKEASALNGKRLAVSQSVQNYISWSKQALWMSLSMLHELRVTFPLHIGLLVYYEDLFRLRKELIKAVTPLYTLYDKLKNVQKSD